MDNERWLAVSELLDEALELTEAERTAWLESLRTRDATLAGHVADLLRRGRASSEEGFLEGGPVLPWVRSLAGQAVGPYVLVEPIGEGGMGTVWLARRADGRYEGEVAVKLLNPALIGLGEGRFHQEGTILARLQHPHIARLLDAGVSAGRQPYLVIEYVPGEHIDLHCARRGLGIEARVHLFLDVLAAVAHAHANLIVHRDLKPSNVLVGTDGQVKLLDFGIAKMLRSERGTEATALTRQGGQVLTPEYAAPEQLTGGAITTATDVYALGVLLYVLLAGRHPAQDVLGSPADLLRAIVDTVPMRLSAAAGSNTRRRRALRGDLDTIVAKALKKEPEERYASVGAMAEDLRRYLERRPISARPDTLAYRATRFVRRNPLPVVLGVVALAALGAGMAGTLWQAREARRQRDLAVAQLRRAENMNEFTYFLLAEAIPDGKALTIAEFLQRAERLVPHRFAEDRFLSLDLLVTIGALYGTRGDIDGADRVLKQAYDDSRRLDDTAVRARAACKWAAGVEFAGRHDEAERMIDEALASLSSDPLFDRVAAECLIERGGMAVERRDPEVALVAGRQILERLRERGGDFPWLRADALHVLARGHDMRNEVDAAERAYAQAAQEYKRTGIDDTNSSRTLYHNWAQTRMLTNPREALELQGHAVRGIAAGPSGEGVTARDLAIQGNLLRLVARYEEARAALETARIRAREQDAPQSLAIATLTLATACRHLRDQGCAAKMLHEVERAYAGDSFLKERWSEFLLERGAQMAARGEHDAARRTLGEALALQQKNPDQQAVRMETLHELARLELAAHRAADAERHARAALALAESVRGAAAHSAWVGQSQLVLAEVIQARGDAATARALLADAAAQMGPTLGEAHPALRDARTRLALLSSSPGR